MDEHPTTTTASTAATTTTTGGDGGSSSDAGVAVIPSAVVEAVIVDDDASNCSKDQQPAKRGRKRKDPQQQQTSPQLSVALSTGIQPTPLLHPRLQTIGGGSSDKRCVTNTRSSSTDATPPPPHPVQQQQLQLQQQQIPPHPAPALPLNGQLLSCFGGFTPVMLHVLENFFAISLRFARDDVVGSLIALSSGMAAAVDTHTVVKNDLMSVNARAERIYGSYQTTERRCEELQSKLEAMKVMM